MSVDTYGCAWVVYIHSSSTSRQYMSVDTLIRLIDKWKGLESTFVINVFGEMAFVNTFDGVERCICLIEFFLETHLLLMVTCEKIFENTALCLMHVVTKKHFERISSDRMGFSQL